MFRCGNPAAPRAGDVSFCAYGDRPFPSLEDPFRSPNGDTILYSPRAPSDQRLLARTGAGETGPAPRVLRG